MISLLLLKLSILLALVQQIKNFVDQKPNTRIVSSEGFLYSSLCLTLNSYLIFFIFLFSDNYFQAKQLRYVVRNVEVLITFINQFINLMPL